MDTKDNLKGGPAGGYKRWLAPGAQLHTWWLNHSLKLPGDLGQLPARSLPVNPGAKPEVPREQIPLHPVSQDQLVTALKSAFQEGTGR